MGMQEVPEEGNPESQPLPDIAAGLWTGAEEWVQGMEGRKRGKG